MTKNPRLIDMSGQRIGAWSVSGQAGNHPRGGALWLCKCDCGTTRTVLGGDLRSGKSVSCGCLKAIKTGTRFRKHGAKRSRLYICWQNMRRRCANLDDPDYGGRGISVCTEWQQSFIPFRDWALSNGYQDDLTIERVDVNDGYSPENCAWADAATQAANRRFVQRSDDGELWWHKAKANGVTRPAYEWRKSKGWPMELVVSWPLGKRRVKRERSSTGQFV